MNKSLLSNLIAVLITLVGVISGNTIILTVGLFALSGAITNWIAIHMLFEKVPLLYGNGVVENRFEEFKTSIHSLIMEQFFTKENLDKFFQSEFSKDDKHFDFTNLINATDFTIAFDSLKATVMESKFGGAVIMFGGEGALDSMKDPFEEKMKKSINEIVHTDTFQSTLQKSLTSSDMSEDLTKKIDKIVIERLNELNPRMVKEMVQKMIKEHLGWLVVWGAVFGGFIGFISSILLG